MQKILLKNVTVTDPKSKWNGKTTDLLIENGNIAKIAASLVDKDAKVIEGKNLHVSPGFFDPTVHFCDPGEEHKEDINSGIATAASGGFTAVGVLGITSPPVTEKTRVEYIKGKASGTAVKLYPSGCVTAKNEGKELAEIYDMNQAGAGWFYDGKKQLNTGILSRALAYSKNFGGVILSYPDDKDLTHGGLMHEGTENIQLGMKGMPAIAEELGVIRDIYLSEYHSAHVHLANVSGSGSIHKLKEAKAKKLAVTAQCSIHHLFFTDEDLHGFDSNLKVQPPLRSKQDRDALLGALKDGTIDNITSDHTPEDIEAKKMEFDLAEYGAAGLETCFAALMTAGEKILGQEKIVEILAYRSRAVFGLPVPTIEEGKACEVVIYNPDEEYTFEKNMQHSKAFNNPYIGKKLKGRVYGVISNGISTVKA